MENSDNQNESKHPQQIFDIENIREPAEVGSHKVLEISSDLIIRLFKLGTTIRFYSDFVAQATESDVMKTLPSITQLESELKADYMSGVVAYFELSTTMSEVDSREVLCQMGTVRLWDTLNEGIRRIVATMIAEYETIRTRKPVSDCKTNLSLLYSNPLEALLKAVDKLDEDKCSKLFGVERLSGLLSLVVINLPKPDSTTTKIIKELHLIRNRFVHHDGRPDSSCREIYDPVSEILDDRIIVGPKAFELFHESVLTYLTKLNASILHTVSSCNPDSIET